MCTYMCVNVGMLMCVGISYSLRQLCSAAPVTQRQPCRCSLVDMT